MSEGTLFVRDSRTSQEYEIPIHRNAVRATAFKAIKAPGDGTNRADKVASGLRVFDPGLQNTTVIETAMTFAYVHSSLFWTEWQEKMILNRSVKQRQRSRATLVPRLCPGATLAK